MFTKKVKTTGGDLSISIPSDISEVTLGLMADLTPGPTHSFSPLEMLSKLSGVPVETPVDTDDICLLDICNTSDISAFDDTLTKLAFQLKLAQASDKLPDWLPVKIGEVKRKKWFSLGKPVTEARIKIVKNLGIQPVGAYNEAREIIKAEFEEWERVKKDHGDDIEFSPAINSLIMVLAHYLYVPATGERWSSAKVSEFVDVVKKLPVSEALPVAKYFFLKYAGYRK